MPGLPEIDMTAEAGGSRGNRALVVGLGPAGQIFAHRAATRGWTVTAYDPRGKNLPSTIGLWQGQLPDWVPANLIAASFRPSIVLADGSSRRLSEEYVVLCNEALNKLGGYEVRREAFECNAVNQRAKQATALADANEPDSKEPEIIIDTRGRYSAEGIAEDGSALPRQLAWGHIFSIADIPAAARDAVLMDFRSVGATYSSIPTFSYRIPLDEDTFLVEETILAIDLKDVSHREAMAVVKQRQLDRLKQLGIDAADAIDEEVVSFPLVRGHQGLSQEIFGGFRGESAVPRIAVGVAGDWMNPATGYSVGAVFEYCDQTLSALEHALDEGSKVSAQPPLSSALYQVRKRGLNALLSFTARETADFFAAFFSLPEEKVMSYLIGNSLRQVLVSMASVAVPLGRRHPRLLGKLIKKFLQAK